MVSEAISLRWPVAASGYYWLRGLSEAADETDRLVIKRTLEDPGGALHRTETPLARPGLFLDFADLGADSRRIRDFATVNGVLQATPTADEKKEAGTPAEKAKTVAGSFGDWVLAIRQMQEVLAQFRGGDDDWLGEDLWNPPKKRPYKKRASTGSGSGTEVFDNQVLRELAFPGRPIPWLVGELTEHLQGGVNLRMSFETPPAWRIHREPRDLLTGLWLQCAVALAERLHFRRCQSCGTWFELSPSVARTSRRVCSDTCKARKYRERVRRAVELWEKGRKIEQIAVLLETDVATVEGWLKRDARR
jgi:hypothetical protein